MGFVSITVHCLLKSLDYALKCPNSFIDSFAQFFLSGLDIFQYVEHNSFLAAVGCASAHIIVEADLFMYKNRISIQSQ